MSEFSDRAKRRLSDERARASALYTSARDHHVSVRFGEELYECDRDANGSVLGSAVALRLFLFSVPAAVTLVGLVNLFGLDGVFEKDLEASVTTGPIAHAVLGSSWWSSFWLFLSGLLLTLWAGRSLTRTLAASSGSAWAMSVRDSKARLISVLAVTGVVVATIVGSAIFREIRDSTGAIVGVVSLGSALALNLVLCYLLVLTLPRPVSDPGAVLPGALLFGIGNTLLQFFMHYYLPQKIARTSDRLGEFATTIAILGNYFVVGRMLTGSFAVSSVTYRRWGSLSAVVFRLPGLAAVARKSPTLREFFSLQLVEREGRKPTIESLPRLDAISGSTDEDLRRDGDERDVEDDL
jgi:hypothetical protein